MLGYIKDAKTFKTVAKYPISSFEVYTATLSGNAGYAIIPEEITNYTGAWFVMGNAVWFISQSAPSDGSTRLTLSDVSEAFGREIVFQSGTETAGGFIAAELSREYINQGDIEYRIPYIITSNNSSVPYFQPELSDGLYTLSEYIRVSRAAGLSFEATVNRDTLEIEIDDAMKRNYPLPLSDGRTMLVSAVFSSDSIAKVTVRKKIKHESVIEAVCDWAVGIAQDERHGYDQIYRWGPDYDCSSFTISAWQQAGVPVLTAGASYTGNMRDKFMLCGFEDITGDIVLSTGAGLVRGDILLQHNYETETGHCAIYLGDGYIVHALSNEHGTATGGQTGDQTGNEICTRAYYNEPWNYVLRYPGGEAEGDTYEDHVFYLTADGRISTDVPEKRAAGRWVFTVCEEDDVPLDVATDEFAQNENAYKIEFYSWRNFELLDTVQIMLPSGNIPAIISEIRKSSSNGMTYYCCGSLPTTLTDKIRR